MDKKFFHNQLSSWTAFFVVTIGLIVLVLLLLPSQIMTWSTRSFGWEALAVRAGEDPLRVYDARVVLLTNGQAVVTWKTNKSADGHVWLSADPTADQWQYLRHDQQYKEHVIEFPPLELATRYYIKIISRTLEGEEDGVPQMVFDSHEPRDLVINDIHWSQPSQVFADFQPQPTNSSLQVAIANVGDQIFTESFFVSALLIPIPDPATDATRTVAETYSCFAEQLVVGGLDARQERLIDFGLHAWHECEAIPAGDYDIVVAIDYADEVREYSEDNNVRAMRFTVSERDPALSFDEVAITEIEFAKANVSVRLPSDDRSRPVYIQYGPRAQVESGVFAETLQLIPTDDLYVIMLEGLQSETEYAFRLLIDGTNVESNIYSFVTLKNPLQDEQRLAALKISNPDCRRVNSQAVGLGIWSKLGLDMPPHEIVRYRILWSSGIWSPWYLPGKGDLDWVKNADGGERRVWSYFDDHQFQYETCGKAIDSAVIRAYQSEQDRLRLEQVQVELPEPPSLEDIYPEVLGVSHETVEPSGATLSFAEALRRAWLYTIGRSNH